MTETTLELNRDHVAVAKRKIQELNHALGTVYSLLGLGRPLNAETATHCLRVAEFTLSDLGKTLGIETDGARERDQRHLALREANCRVRELEAQLGNAAGADVTQAGIEALGRQLDGWWDLEGFGLIREVSFEKHGGCKVNFSCSLHGDFARTQSETPVSDAERRARWLDDVRGRGFVLAEDDRDWVVMDCDASRQALCDLVARRLPSARVLTLENFNRSAAGGFTVRSVEVYISRLVDILDLPVKPAG